MLRLLAMTFFLISSSLAFAGGTSGYGKITNLFIEATGDNLIIKFDQPTKNPMGCQKTGIYVAPLYNTRGGDRFYSAILSAYMTQKRVKFWISGCSKNYWGGTRPKITTMDF